MIVKSVSNVLNYTAIKYIFCSSGSLSHR